MRLRRWATFGAAAVTFLACAPTSSRADPVALVTSPSAHQTAVNEARLKWKLATAKHLRQFLSFPDELRELDLTTMVLMKVRVDKKRKIQAPEIVKSSGFTAVDDAAKAAVLRASPLPKPPEVAGIVFPSWMVLPIRFSGSPPPKPDAPPH